MNFSISSLSNNLFSASLPLMTSEKFLFIVGSVLTFKIKIIVEFSELQNIKLQQKVFVLFNVH